MIDWKTKAVRRITPDQLIEQARILAGQSRDQYATPLYRVIKSSTLPRSEYERVFVAEMTNRMGLVMESFLIGAAMTLKLLHDDGSPEPLECNRRERLHELLVSYGLLLSDSTNRSEQPPPSVIPGPSTTTSSTPKGE